MIKDNKLSLEQTNLGMGNLFNRPKINYGTNLIQMLGKDMLRSIRRNIELGDHTFKDILPTSDLINEASYYLEYNPLPGYNLTFQKNPRFMNTSSPHYDPQIGVSQAIESFYTGKPIRGTDVNPLDFKITGSIPFNIK